MTVAEYRARSYGDVTVSTLEIEQVQQENIRLTQRLALQAEELTAMRNQLDTLTAKSTTDADAMQLLTTRTTNAAARAQADLEQAQRQIDSVTEDLRMSKLEAQAIWAMAGVLV